MFNSTWHALQRATTALALAMPLAACAGSGLASSAAQATSQDPATSPQAPSADSKPTTPGDAVVVAAAEPRPPQNECASPHPAWIWCDDFEQDRSAYYFEATMPRRAGVGLNGSHGIVGRYTLGSSEAGNLKLAFGRTPSPAIRPADDGTKNYREIYWRFYLKHPANWQGGGADKLSRATVFAGPAWEQAMIAHVWSGQNDEETYLKLDPATGTDSAGRVITTGYNDFARLRWLGATHGKEPLFVPERFGQWQCIESRVRLNDSGKANGVFELWINGKLSARRTDINWVGSYDKYGINAVFLENYWNAGSPVEQERYMDNFVISTARIGCG